MSFSDDIKKFTEKAKKGFEEAKEQLAINAKNRLQEVLGDEADKIKSIKLDADVGKFYDVDAPESVLKKLRNEGLLK